MSDQSNPSEETNSTEATQAKHPGIISVIKSVLAAMVGIQSEENRKRDFEQGNLWNYLAVGVVMVFLFVITLVSIVNSILEEAGR